MKLWARHYHFVNHKFEGVCSCVRACVHGCAGLSATLHGCPTSVSEPVCAVQHSCVYNCGAQFTRPSNVWHIQLAYRVGHTGKGWLMSHENNNHLLISLEL